MLTKVAKNAIIIISLSLIFIPAQIFASTVEQLLETLHSRPQQKVEPTPNNTPENIIIIQPEVLEPTIIQPNTPESPNAQIILPNIIIDTNQNVTTPTAPTIIVPNAPISPDNKPLEPVIPEAIKENKTSNFIPLTPMPEDNASQQNKEQQAQKSPVEQKTKPQVIAPSFSLTDFLIQTTQDEQNKLIDENKPTTKPKVKLAEKISPPKQEKPAEKISPPANKTPKEKETPPKQKKAEDKKKGAPLKIPEDAKKTGNMEFLEGCWVGYRPEYHTKRMVTERFCFDANGSGKRYIVDPKIAGTCVGSTKALVNKDGLLVMDSEESYCTPSGKRWGASKMQCQGEGEQTPCSWNFSDISGASQSYKINFVRE